MTATALAPIAFGGIAFAWGFVGFWILVGALIVALVRATRTPPRDSGGGVALRVLEERYARGEITREDYLERRAVLGGSAPGASGD